ncbi:MAG: type ISP restriction/modification enzyme, partial [Bacteroides sp.]
AFDEIYILNLHGNSRLKEHTPEGGKDENVFDIQVGVSTIFLIKYKKARSEGSTQLHYAELCGLRKEKFVFVQTLSLESPEWKCLYPRAPYYFFVPKELMVSASMTQGFSLRSLFFDSGLAPLTKRDKAIVQFSSQGVMELLRNLEMMKAEEFRAFYQLGEDTDWQVNGAILDVKKNHEKLLTIDYFYRPFDLRKVPYTGQKGLFARPCFGVLGVMLHPKNYALCTTRQVRDSSFHHSFLTTCLPDKAFISDGTYAFPLYKFPDGWDYTPAEIVAGTTKDGEPIELELNMRCEILDKISKEVGEDVRGEDVFDYIYGVLNDKEYREKYIEFLKIDYPRIPYPKDKAEYQRFVEKGRWLRRLHLMDKTLEIPITATFSITGSNLVEFVKYEGERVWINDVQYFGNVPRAVWDHYVGSYQPARLWLQKRVGRVLSFDDIEWYLRVVSTIGAEVCNVLER